LQWLKHGSSYHDLSNGLIDRHSDLFLGVAMVAIGEMSKKKHRHLKDT